MLTATSHMCTVYRFCIFGKSALGIIDSVASCRLQNWPVCCMRLCSSVHKCVSVELCKLACG